VWYSLVVQEDIRKLKMKEALQDVLGRYLKEKGFVGRLPHFRRFRENEVHVLTIQFNTHGGSYVVEVTKFPTEFKHPSLGIIDPKKLTSGHAAWQDRKRLNPTKSEDYWFDYSSFTGNSEPFRNSAESVIPLIESQAEKLWSER